MKPRSAVMPRNAAGVPPSSMKPMVCPSGSSGPGRRRCSRALFEQPGRVMASAVYAAGLGRCALG
jgi:hypothetical protein